MRNARLAVLVLVTTVAACVARPPADGPPVDGPPRTGRTLPPTVPADPQPRPEPRSRHGNGPIYEVYGQPYRVLDTSHGYTEQGVASWYGRKFHGRLTSNQEPYDMHALTAAHKTLPLPTYVQVRNLKNGKSVVVRVNDRGPFVDNRLIDLSYAAARRLELVDAGTGLVEVTAISYDDPPATADTPAGDAADEPPNKVYVQVGAFGERGNAERRFALLQQGGIDNAFVHREAERDQDLFRVRIGPIADVGQYDTVVAQLQTLGIADSHLVSE